MSVYVPMIVPVAPFWAPAAWLREACMGAIALYQRHLSPLKGFRCAHAVWHRDESCSCYVKRAIAEGGVRQAFQLLGPRFEACREAAARCAARRNERRSRVREAAEEVATEAAVEAAWAGAEAAATGCIEGAGECGAGECGMGLLECAGGCAFC